MRRLAPLLPLLLCACGPLPLALEPRSPDASEVATLWWVMLAISVFVFLLVCVTLGIALWHRGSDDPHETESTRPGPRFVVFAGIVFPLVVLTPLSFVSYSSAERVSAAQNVSQTSDIVVELIGYMWWWDVRYVGENFALSNEIHIPVGERVQINLMTADVIHSFWVPQLTGKMDLMPGQVNAIWVQAEEPGVYFGKCAEFCGLQHANMNFLLVAHAREDFDAWLENERQDAVEPQTDIAQRGQEVFLSSTCATCHPVRGTNAFGAFGPDLTHFASRSTIGAGMMPNNRGNLAGWLMDPQSLKPGVFMPSINLPSEDMLAIVAYLETLR